MGLNEAQKNRTGLGSISAQSSKDEVGGAICGKTKITDVYSLIVFTGTVPGL